MKIINNIISISYFNFNLPIWTRECEWKTITIFYEISILIGIASSLSKWYPRIIRSYYIQPSILSNILCRVIYRVNMDQRRTIRRKKREKQKNKKRASCRNDTRNRLRVYGLDFFSFDARNEWSSPWTGRREKMGDGCVTVSG